MSSLFYLQLVINWLLCCVYCQLLNVTVFLHKDNKPIEPNWIYLKIWLLQTHNLSRRNVCQKKIVFFVCTCHHYLLHSQQLHCWPTCDRERVYPPALHKTVVYTHPTQTTNISLKDSFVYSVFKCKLETYKHDMKCAMHFIPHLFQYPRWGIKMHCTFHTVYNFMLILR